MPLNLQSSQLLLLSSGLRCETPHMAIRWSKVARKRITCPLHKTTKSEEMAVLSSMSTLTAWSSKPWRGRPISGASCFAYESNQSNGRDYLVGFIIEKEFDILRHQSVVSSHGTSTSKWRKSEPLWRWSCECLVSPVQGLAPHSSLSLRGVRL